MYALPYNEKFLWNKIFVDFTFEVYTHDMAPHTVQTGCDNLVSTLHLDC